MEFTPINIDFQVDDNALWIPIYTQPLHEFRLQQYFNERGIPNYLPVIPKIKIQNVNSGKTVYKYEKVIAKPMFSSYIFAALTPEQKIASWRSKSVIRYFDVPFEQQKEFIDELHGVKMMETLGQKNALEFGSEFQVGDRFVIETPPFQGVYGYLEKKKKKFIWIIRIECMGSFIATEIDPSIYQMKKVDI